MTVREELKNRVAKIREAMREQRLDTLLIYDSGRHNFLRMNYVAYVTDFINIGPDTLLLLPLDGTPLLYVSPVWDVARAAEESAIGEVRPFSELWARLARLPGTVGIAGREAMNAVFHEQLTQTVGRVPANSKDILDRMARRKSPFEIERLRTAAVIADAGVQALHEEARPGLKEYELAAIVEYRMRSLGAEDNFGMVVANDHNQALHPPTDRVVQSGDIIIGEITPCVRGLFVQICRTMVLGDAPPVLREKYAILKHAMGLGMDAAENGAPASAIASAINAVLVEAGYEKYCRPPFMRVRGHGLGCGSPAPGNLEDGNTTTLEEGMSFIIHPNQYLPETGYLTLGDTVLMNGERAESLMRSSWELFVKG
jgi:Xaa-Pro aminopeptidase